ncbi:hypothetical protein IKJ53_01890 [bacterium]|nr:hypothetical protein [bacterium]
MKLSAINGVNMLGSSQTVDKKSVKKPFTDNFQNKIKNSADMADCVNVPRTIFKGYLSFMAGTTMMTVASFFKAPVVRKSLSVAGSLVALAGTWCFVRPYVVKDAVPTVDLNKKA